MQYRLQFGKSTSPVLKVLLIQRVQYFQEVVVTSVAGISCLVVEYIFAIDVTRD